MSQSNKIDLRVFDFDRFPPVKSITVNKHVISNFKLKGLGLEKVSIK